MTLAADRSGNPLPDFPDAHLLAAWDKHLSAGGLSDNTRRAYRRDVGVYAEWLGSRALTLADMNRRTCREYLAWLRTKGNGGGAYAATTVSRMLAAVRSLYAYLVRLGWYDVSPAPSARSMAVRKPSPLPRFLGRSEVRRLLDAPQPYDAAGRRDKAILEMAYATGVRLAELAGLDVGDIDRRHRAAAVTGKGGHRRRVLFGSPAAMALEDYLAYGRPLILADVGEVGHPTALWLNLGGGRLSRRWISLMTRRYARKAGLTGEVTIHALRHSYAMHMVEGGADLRTVQQQLGHASPESTTIYTYITQQESRRALMENHPRANPGRRRDRRR